MPAAQHRGGALGVEHKEARPGPIVENDPAGRVYA